MKRLFPSRALSLAAACTLVLVGLATPGPASANTSEYHLLVEPDENRYRVRSDLGHLRVMANLQRDFLLSLAIEGSYRPLRSSAILTELEEHEALKLIDRGSNPDEARQRAVYLIEQMRQAFDDAEVTGMGKARRQLRAAGPR